MILYSVLSNGLRAPGGQKKRFKDTIWINLKIFHIDRQTNWGELAQNRTAWRNSLYEGATLHEEDLRHADWGKWQFHIPLPAHHFNVLTARKYVVSELALSVIWGPTIRTPQEDHHPRLWVIADDDDDDDDGVVGVVQWIEMDCLLSEGDTCVRTKIC